MCVFASLLLSPSSLFVPVRSRVDGVCTGLHAVVAAAPARGPLGAKRGPRPSMVLKVGVGSVR